MSVHVCCRCRPILCKQACYVNIPNAAKDPWNKILNAPCLETLDLNEPPLFSLQSLTLTVPFGHTPCFPLYSEEYQQCYPTLHHQCTNRAELACTGFYRASSFWHASQSSMGSSKISWWYSFTASLRAWYQIMPTRMTWYSKSWHKIWVVSEFSLTLHSKSSCFRTYKPHKDAQFHTQKLYYTVYNQETMYSLHF